MRNIRIFVDTALAGGSVVRLDEAQSAHLVRVLRLGVGDACVLFNGDGRDYAGRLLRVGKRECEVEISDSVAVDSESPLRLHLLQSIARGEKMDWILQKATELGVASVWPVVTERTEVRLDAERAEKRHQHWLGVLRAACEQCGRARVPALQQAQGLPQALAQIGEGWRRVLDPEAAVSLLAAGPAAESGYLLIGPEGGLSEGDLRAARSAGFSGARLGPRILRTETAGLAALAMLQARFGDCG